MEGLTSSSVQPGGEDTVFGAGETWIGTLALQPVTCWVTLDQFLHLPEPQFPRL